MITLGLRPEAAEAGVFGMGHGTGWLSLQPQGGDTPRTRGLPPGQGLDKDYS